MAADGHTAAVTAFAGRIAMDIAFERQMDLPGNPRDKARRPARFACSTRAAAFRARVRALGTRGGREAYVRHLFGAVAARQADGKRPRLLPAQGRRLTGEPVPDEEERSA